MNGLHPRLFSAPMVRALLADQKTQTRRAVARHNSLVDGGPASDKLWDTLDFSKAWVDGGPSPAGNEGPYLKVPGAYEMVHRVYSRVSAGDLIWGREAWRVAKHFDQAPPRDIPPGAEVWYEATSVAKQWRETVGKLRPSMFMPRWMCRLELPVTAVRPQRLTDIDEADAIAEGITCQNVIVAAHAAGGRHTEVTQDRFFYDGGSEEGYDNGIDAYLQLWEHINGQGEANKNPLVWAYTFTRRQP